MGKQLYDVIIIGGGAAGLVAAKFARGLGKKVAIIEINKLGGECTWTGCVPSKALIQYAKIQSIVNSTKTNPANIHKYITEKVNLIYKSHTPESLESEGIVVLFGSPTFINKTTLSLNKNNEHLVSAKKIIIATGSSPFIPNISGLKETTYLTNESIFNLTKAPQRLGIIGAGPIGIEMAGAFNKLGSQVTVFEQGEAILSHEDRHLSQTLRKSMEQEGVEFLLQANISSISQKNKIITITSNNQQFEVDELLIAAGRKPNIRTLNLEAAGVSYTHKSITVNKKLQTTASNIYACGDVVGPYQFSHVADYQAVIATHNALIPFFKRKVCYKTVPWVTFSSPELARLGLTEQEAIKRYNNNIKIYSIPYNKIDRAVVDNNSIGFAKVICDKNYTIIGAHILGARSGEILHELVVSKAFGIKLYKLNNIMHAYPCYSDVIKRLARQCYIDKMQHSFLAKLAKYFFKEDKIRNE